MSAMPQDADGRRPRPDTDLLVDAYHSQAKAREWVAERDARVRQAINDSAQELVYRWQTPDHREAEMQIFYRRGEEVDLLTVQLRKIDYRQPTVQERARYEDDFDAEMAAASDLWLDVASRMAV